MALTPMMQQYLEVKERCKDCILFFRLGDFYEMFWEDAEVASKELELTLTGKDCGLEERAPMCGIPFHAANTYISRLVSKGYKIAICEQMEDPASAKGIVKRDIVKIVTPGTYTDSSFLQENKNNYIMSIYLNDNKLGLSFSDISTGEFKTTYSGLNISLIMDEISKFLPKEILIPDNLPESIVNSIKERFNISFTKLTYDYYNNENLLDQQFKNLNEVELSQEALKSSGALLKYIIETQKTILSHIDEINYYSSIDYLSIDINSRRNLELTESLRDKNKKGSLLWVLDKTCTSMGARMLRNWIDQPLMNKEYIQQRLDSVEELKNNIGTIQDLKEVLKDIYDIERIVGKVSSKSVNAKELIALKDSISKVPAVKNIIASCSSKLLNKIYKSLDDLKDIFELLESSILENPSLGVKEGYIIKDGYNDYVDELRKAKIHGKEWIAKLENNEREITGIKSLKVGYNKVFGYYIEITKANFSLIPEGRYLRKQTLANAERFITPELKEMEEKILGAEEKLINVEYELFVEIRQKIEEQIDRMKLDAKLIAELDCILSLAVVALENNYCKPKISINNELTIKDGRHPVVEKMISSGSFVSNDTNLDVHENQLILITGPNMAGKSTYMRQVALITIMAQIGSFVPAKEAVVSICDKIFTRIGASDDLAGGKSTFMVEMWEVSNILNNATNKSLIILDEVGRGTSTYDGLSIAWAVIEHICDNNKLRCKTLFATHYHELTKLEGTIKGVKNYSVSVKEYNNEIIFLRKIIRGGADQSYGIEVAKLAGLPEEVIKRSKEILLSIESNDTLKQKDVSLIANKEEAAVDILNDSKLNASLEFNHKYKKEKDKKDTVQLNINDLQKDSLIKEICSIDILKMNPMEGFNKLYDLIEKAKTL